METNNRISKLREKMLEKGLSAYIIPSTDSHISEYVADRWKSKTWLTGFTGSVATIVVTKNKSGIWVDSRYWLQAENELSGTEVEVFKFGKDGVLNYPEWLVKELSEGDTIGYDGMSVPLNQDKSLKSLFSYYNINIDTNHDLIDLIWDDRPLIPRNEIFIHKLEYAGKSRTEKIQEVRNSMNEKKVDAHIIATLDDNCWLFNIRGRDVEFNPVAYCYSVITNDSAELYIYKEKITDEVREELEKDNIKLFDYNQIFDRIKQFENKKIYIDPARINAGLVNSIPKTNVIVEGMNFSTLLKATKNPTELNGMRSAMVRDCVAMVKFGYWLENNIGKTTITEIDTMNKIREFRRENELFFGESFNTIAGYKGNGAIVHYSSTPETNQELKPEGIFLLDSGGQYYDGTTDITRVYHLGEPTEQEMIDYTLVLKGHIQINLAVFPTNTRGSQLDILARNSMWKLLINYGHGTGHGVGCFMNVHEGPQNIRMEENPVTLRPGMILSNEPGLYRTGQYGLRIENLVNVVEAGETEFGKFLKFEVLTLCPIDLKPVKKDMLTEEEINWLNSYHQRVYDSVKDLLDDEHRKWLLDKTKAI